MAARFLGGADVHVEEVAGALVQEWALKAVHELAGECRVAGAGRATQADGAFAAFLQAAREAFEGDARVDEPEVVVELGVHRASRGASGGIRRGRVRTRLCRRGAAGATMGSRSVRWRPLEGPSLAGRGGSRGHARRRQERATHARRAGCVHRWARRGRRSTPPAGALRVVAGARPPRRGRSGEERRVELLDAVADPDARRLLEQTIGAPWPCPTIGTSRTGPRAGSAVVTT